MNGTLRVGSGLRITSGLLLLLHALVVGVLPIADARLERGGGDGVVHVESEDRPSCPTGHDHLKCQLCRVASSSLLAAADPARVPQHHAVQPGNQFAVVIVFATAPSDLPVGSRAPPIA